MSNNLLFAEPKLAEFIRELQAEATKWEMEVIVAEVDRTPEKQVALYAQGRCSQKEVNILRDRAGLPEITEAENKNAATEHR